MDEDDEKLDETAEEDAAFGGDGVRARTSTAFRDSEDSDEEIAEVETEFVVVTDTSAVGTVDDEEEDEVVPLLLTVRVSALEGGDEDLDRDTTSTTFNAEEEEEDDIVEDGDSMLDTGGIEDIEQERLWCPLIDREISGGQPWGPRGLEVSRSNLMTSMKFNEGTFRGGG